MLPFASAVYVQNLDPLGNRPLSTFVAALPVLVLFYLLIRRRWLASESRSTSMARVRACSRASR